MNKYEKWYNSIVERGNKRYLNEENLFPKNDHHILPKCLGGTNDQENIARLTLKEHYICHWLLTKIYTGNNKRKMIWAFWCMCNMKGNPKSITYKIPSRVYEIAKNNHIKNMQRRKIIFSPETIEKMKQSHLGKKLSKETKKKLSMAHKGQPKTLGFTGKKLSEETKKKFCYANKGRKFTEKHKKKLSMAHKGKIPWNKGINKRPCQV